LGVYRLFRLFAALRIHMSASSKAALDAYKGYHLMCRGEVPVKGKGNMRTYFLCGRDGFEKELPLEHETEEMCMRNIRASVTSLNSMMSYVSQSSISYPSPDSMKKVSLASSTISEDYDDKYKSKQTSILEVTCL